MKRMASQHVPDFLYTWRRASLERQAYEPGGDAGNLSRATGQEATSEAEALHRWLTDGGDLDCAALYGLEIIVGDETRDQFSAEKPRSMHIMVNNESVTESIIKESEL